MQYQRHNPPPANLFQDWQSATAEGNCVEIADGPEGWKAIRDSKDEGSGPVLRFTPGEWSHFRDGILAGKLI